MPIPRGWRSRGHLPHADFAGLTQAVTFRLGDALPDAVLERLRLEVTHEMAGDTAAERRAFLLSNRVQAWLDAGHGSCRLVRTGNQQAVSDELHRHDGIRYRLDAYVVMPNHVHVLLGTGSTALGKIIQGWKGASARTINGLDGLAGSLWQREYYDRFLRDEEHAIAAIRYIAANPEKARIGGRDWPGLWIREGLRRHLYDTAD